MASNCTGFGEDEDMLYGFTARKLRRGLEVVICLPSIQNPIEFDIDADHAKDYSDTHLGYQLQQAQSDTVIYTDESQMPRHLKNKLKQVCTLVHHTEVRFRMCVGQKDVFLPTAEYEGGEVRYVDQPVNNRCNHEFDSPIEFLQEVLEYPCP